MARFCIICGCPLEAGDAFCGNCGEPIPQDQVFQPIGSGGFAPMPTPADTYAYAPAPTPTPTPTPTPAPAVMPVQTQTPAQTPAPAMASAPIPASNGGDYDDSTTEVWGVRPIHARVASSADADDEDYSPTIVATQPTQPTKRYVLVRMKSQERVELEPPCIVGRGSAADYRVKGNPAISRAHIKVTIEDGEVTIQDLSSTNSTYVEGTLLPEMGKSVVKDGAVLRLGNEDFKFVVETA